MEDEQSTAPVEEVVQPTQDEPATDPILGLLASDEDTSSAEPVEPQSAEQEEPEVEAEPEAEQPKEETEDLQPEVDPKEEARKRYEERQRQNQERRQQIESAAAENAEKHIKLSEDEYDQRLRQTEAKELIREAEQYVNNIEHNENLLVSEFERVKANPDLQIFNPDNKKLFNEKAYNKAVRDFNAGYVSYDDKGNIVGVKSSLFEHLTETAELLRGAVQSGAVQQVRDSRKMRTSADPKPAAPPKEAQKDAILEALKSD